MIGGVGVNGGFAVRELPEEVHETATTLQDAVGQRVDVDDLRERVIERVWERVGLFESEGMRERDRCAIEGRLAMRGELVRVEAGGDRVIEGILEGVGIDGRALVKSGGAVVGVGAGEVVRARTAAVRE